MKPPQPYWAIYLVIFIAGFTQANAMPELDAFGNTPYYDYSLTRTYLAYNTDNRVVLLGNPFQQPARGMGVTLYAILLKYADRYEDLVFPVDQPSFHVVLFGKGQVRHIYVGEFWLQYADKIVFMNNEDNKRVQFILSKRFANGEIYSEDMALQRINRKLSQEPLRRLDEAASLAKARSVISNRLRIDREGDGDYVSKRLPNDLAPLRKGALDAVDSLEADNIHTRENSESVEPFNSQTTDTVGDSKEAAQVDEVIGGLLKPKDQHEPLEETLVLNGGAQRSGSPYANGAQVSGAHISGAHSSGNRASDSALETIAPAESMGGDGVAMGFTATGIQKCIVAIFILLSLLVIGSILLKKRLRGKVAMR